MTETNGVTVGFQLPILEVRHRDMDLEILLISRASKRFMFHEVINVLEEEGADVVNASFSTVGDKIFHTIHSKVIITLLFFPFLVASKSCGWLKLIKTAHTP